jgi:hypothetical protein
MAVVQISRIQVRRGQKNVTGMPQLASGEIAWAVDTQELYIGNGSVFEGSPGVGNTKILTQNDLTIQGNLLNLLQHIYRVNDTEIQTGPTSNDPVTRSVQDRLDDRVTAFDFGALGNYNPADLTPSNDTAALQRAIDQLFFNSAAESFQDNINGIQTRRVLEIPQGRYRISSALVIPSYATIIGAGSDKTIIEYTGTGTAIEFQSDIDIDGDPLPWENNQPRFITLKGFSLHTATNNQTAINMYAVRDSIFEDLNITGDVEIIPGTQVLSPDSIGIKLDLDLAHGDVVCKRNFFNNITISNFHTAVFSDRDILNNTFSSGYISKVVQGFVLGYLLVGGSGVPLGERYGPRKNTIDNYNFENIKQHAVYVGLGTDNTVKNSTLTEVGQDGGGITATQYPQIYFKNPGNASENNSSDRWQYFYNETYRSTPYIPEVTGWGNASSYGNKNINLASNAGSPLLAFRLPVVTDSGGLPKGSVVYVIDYIFQSTSSTFTRRGTLTVSADLNNVYGQLSDDYDYAGPTDSTVTAATLLDFSLEFRDEAGDSVAFGANETVGSIAVKYVNPSDTGYFTYSYKTAFSNQNS